MKLPTPSTRPTTYSVPFTRTTTVVLIVSFKVTLNTASVPTMITEVVLIVNAVGTLVTFNTTVLDWEPTYLSSPA